MSNNTSYQDRIIRARQDGLLFAHTFETSLEIFLGAFGAEEVGKGIKELFEVMAGREGAEFHNPFRSDIKASRTHGFMGLSATAMHADFPVSLWCDTSKVGFLMDGRDTNHIKPIFVSSGDAYTHVKETKLFWYSTSGNIPALYSAQNLHRFKDESCPYGIYHFDMSRDIDTNTRGASNAIAALWQEIESMGWDKYFNMRKDYPGMNEVVLLAHLKGVCGIIVYNGDDVRCIAPYSRSMQAALEVQKLMATEYADLLPEPLPIVVYQKARDPVQQTVRPELKILSVEEAQAIANAKRRTLGG